MTIVNLAQVVDRSAILGKIHHHEHAVSDLNINMASSEQQPHQPQQTHAPTKAEAIHFSCTNCDIKFDSESSLRVHLQVCMTPMVSLGCVNVPKVTSERS